MYVQFTHSMPACRTADSGTAGGERSNYKLLHVSNVFVFYIRRISVDINVASYFIHHHITNIMLLVCLRGKKFQKHAYILCMRATSSYLAGSMYTTLYCESVTVISLPLQERIHSYRYPICVCVCV